MKAKRILPLLLVLLLFAASRAGAANPIWVGAITGIGPRYLDDTTFLLSLTLDEDTTDGEFGRFDEDKIVFITSANEGKEVKIILDGVSAGTFADKTFTFNGYIREMRIKNIVGSFYNPDLRYTLSDREIFSAEITFVSERKLTVVRVPIDKSDTRRIELNIKLLVEVPPPEKVEPGAKPANVLELTPDDFADPFPSNLIDLTGGLNKQLKMLNDLPEDGFVTFFYPLKYMRPSSARSLFARKLSPWGWMEVNDDHGLLIITDYVNYVRSIVESLLVYDRPVPQVELTAKVIEVTLTEEQQKGFVHTFRKALPDATNITVGSEAIRDVYGMNGITGSVAHYSGDNLRRFMTMLNLAVQKGAADVLATPRALVVNNQTADFRVGQTYYYIGPGNVTSVTKHNERGKEDTENKDVYDERNQTSYYNFRTLNTGVSLNVRPFILNSDQIRCSIQLSYDEVVSFSPETGLPVLATRRLSSTVRLKEGQTLVIGGLFREKELTVRKKIPGLGDIPVVKFFFTSKRRVKVKTELVFILMVNRVH